MLKHARRKHSADLHGTCLQRINSHKLELLEDIMAGFISEEPAAVNYIVRPLERSDKPAVVHGGI